MTPYKFDISEKRSGYTLQNVIHKGHPITVEWSKRLLEDDKRRTQEEWVKATPYHSDEFMPSPSLYHSVIVALFSELDRIDNFENRLEKKIILGMLELLKSDLTKNALMTSAAVLYTSNGRDIMSNNHKTPDQYFSEIDLSSHTQETMPDQKTAIRQILEAENNDELEVWQRLLADRNESNVQQLMRLPKYLIGNRELDKSKLLSEHNYIRLTRNLKSNWVVESPIRLRIYGGATLEIMCESSDAAATHNVLVMPVQQSHAKLPPRYTPKLIA